MAAQIHDPAGILSEATNSIQANQFNAARSLLEEGTGRYPRNSEMWNLLGIADAELGKTTEAAQAFRRGLREAPDSVSLNENLGLLFYKRANYEKTIYYLTRALQLGSQQPGVLFSLAASQLRTGEPGKALSQLKALEPAMGNLEAYWEERGRAEVGSSAADAEMSFGRALRLEPDNLEALNGAAAAAEKQGLDEKALSYLVRARSAAPEHEQTLVHFASVCIRRDLGPDAIEALEKAHRLDPNNLSILFLRARAYIAIQDWQRSYDDFGEYSKRAPKDASAFYAMGWVAIQLGRTEDARRRLEHCLALDPHLTDARYELAQLELNEGELGLAAQQLGTVLKQNPQHAKAQMALGEFLLRRGDFESARIHLGEAVRLDPTLAPAHYKLSIVLFRQHEDERAGQERALAASLEAEAKRASKVQLKLVLPGERGR